MSPPVVSVIMPMLQAAAHAAEAAFSVLAQDLSDVELVVVDDGSTDGGPDIVRRMVPDATVVTGPHQGIASARNTGVRAARGRYLTFLDADDVLPPGSLEVRHAALDNDPGVAAVFGRVEEFISADAEGTPGRRGPMAVTDARVLATMLIRREAFFEVGEFDAGAARWYNVDWFARFGASGLASSQIPDVVVRRRLHDSNFGLSAGVQGEALLGTLRAALGRTKREPDAPA